jgi:Spy/CpxP family protein refolding chaperone
MMIANAKADAAFYATLNPEQQSKMKEMEAHRGRGMRGMPGHGGPPPGAFFRKP